MVEKYPKNFLPKDPDLSTHPKVSVLITTYNQEKLITQAIDSVLMQVTNFSYEIVIGEDASSDRTREIVVELARQHPEKIRVLLRDPEVANRERHLYGKMNFLQALASCRGEYIAVLDGDDQFTSPHKLQKQVDFLDARPDCVICFHNVKAVYKDESTGPENLCSDQQKEITDIEQLLWGNFIPSCSIMYRREPAVRIPDWFLTAKVGDWPLHIFKAQYGKIGYLNEVLSAYRVHQAGVWSLGKRSRQLLISLRLLDHIDRELDFKYHATIRRSKARMLFELAEVILQSGHSRLALVPVKRGLWCSRGRHKGILSLWLRLQTPGLYRGFRSLKGWFSSV
jgi:glycosyltransferase involved in cell wall biosynthesis